MSNEIGTEGGQESADEVGSAISRRTRIGLLAFTGAVIAFFGMIFCTGWDADNYEALRKADRTLLLLEAIALSPGGDGTYAITQLLEIERYAKDYVADPDSFHACAAGLYAKIMEAIETTKAVLRPDFGTPIFPLQLDAAMATVKDGVSTFNGCSYFAQ